MLVTLLYCIVLYVAAAIASFLLGRFYKTKINPTVIRDFRWDSQCEKGVTHVYTRPTDDDTTTMVAHEMFEKGGYIGSNGITMPKEDAHSEPPLVVDCGGHIGLFSNNIARKLKRFEILAFEPVDVLRHCAEKNLKRQNLNDTDRKYTLVPVAVSDKKYEEISFTFDPRGSAGGSLFPELIQGQAFASLTSILACSRAVAKDHLSVGVAKPAWMWQIVLVCLSIPVFNAIFLFAVLPVVMLYVFFTWGNPVGTRVIKVPANSLSNLLKQYGYGDTKRPIAMLKIDVEGAEELVMNGISDEDMMRVQQLILEIHETADGRVARIESQLRDKFKFKSVVRGNPDEDFEIQKVLHIYTLYASRL